MSAGQYSAAEVANMQPEEVTKALNDGRLNALLVGDDPGRPREPFTPPADVADQGARGKTFPNARAWLRSLPPDDVARLLREGALDDLLRGDATT